jgi:hypothetical protein
MLLKAAVVTSSLLLAGGLVFYRAGAFDGILKTGGATQAAIVPGAQPPDTPDARISSDSVLDRRSDASAEDSARRARMFFYGSKSSPDIIRSPLSDSAKEAQLNASGEPRRDTVRRLERHMGGSKSLAPLIETPESDTERTATPQSPGPK